MHILGITCSISAGFFWAVAIILFKKSGEVISPMSLNLFKSTVTLFLLGITMVFSGVSIFTGGEALYDWLLFGLSGFIGIALADTLFFMALLRLGAGMTALVDCLYLPFVIIMSFVFLDETLGMKGICGAALVIAAIFAGSVSPGDMTSRGKNLVSGITLGITSVLFIAGSIVMLKGRLEHVPVLWASFTRILAGTAGLYIMTLLRPNRKRIFAELKPSKTWYWAFPASVSGNYLAMVLWLAGMKYTMVSVAAILNQLSTVFIVVLSSLFLKERLTVSRITATVMAVAGAMLAASAAN